MTDSQLRLRPPRNRADRRAISWWTTDLAIWIVPLVAVLVVLAVLLPDARAWLIAPAALGALLGGAIVVGLPRLWYRNHLWEIADSAVYARRGWFWVSSRIAPMSRIQTVDTRRGPLEQRFGLATVTVTTASSRGAIELSGLPFALAEEIAQQLTEMTQATPGDAT